MGTIFPVVAIPAKENILAGRIEFLEWIVCFSLMVENGLMSRNAGKNHTGRTIVYQLSGPCVVEYLIAHPTGILPACIAMKQKHGELFQQINR